jgi:ubiquinone/menaquinone biosynthesis C-methylase UbiE
VKEKNLNIVKEHWEKKETVSLRDKNLKILEQNTIIDYIKRSKKNTLMDIGCGDASDTVKFAQYVNKVYAYDYSKAMLSKSADIIEGIDNISLDELNILEDQINQKTDLVITKRLLINLGNFDNQKNAIRKIHNSIEEDGYYIMLETSIEGLKNLNELRVKVGLDIIPEPYHNTLFDLNILKEFLNQLFVIEDIKYFSTYYFLTRVYNPLLNSDNEFNMIQKQRI